MSWLEKIRQKSDSEKRLFSFNVALAITIVIFAIWVVSAANSFQNLDEEQSQTATPLKSITQSIKSLLSDGSEDVYNSAE